MSARYSLRILVVSLGLLAPSALAHDRPGHTPLVIDTDMGLDDVVTVALALQTPGVELRAIVACPGVVDGKTAVTHLERMLDLFNRPDVALYAASKNDIDEVPPFRHFAAQDVARALPATAPRCRRPFSPAAYTDPDHRTVVLLLGPPTNLAGALKQRLSLRQEIAGVIIAGEPDAEANWNLRADPRAAVLVGTSGLPQTYVVPGPAGGKPQAWKSPDFAAEPGTSIAEGFLSRLFEDAAVRTHYLERLATFHDELALLYVVNPSLFDERYGAATQAAADSAGVLQELTTILTQGRQGKPHVILLDRPLPDGALRSDVRRRRAAIVAENGEVEWFAQLLTSEIHEHLGAYSIIGVKMGLRAAELLNAPTHGLRVISHVPPRPPVSCLNDGLIVAAGSTPGRGLFTHEPTETGAVSATFECNGRRIRLTLKEDYRRRVRDAIAALLKKYTLEDAEYWAGVRALGLDICEKWHRRELFDVVRE